MFVGHFAVGLAAKKVAPRISLGVTFAACQLLDLVWPVLVLAGVERVSVDPAASAFTPLDFEYYPWSHSLGMAVVWSGLGFVLLKLFKRSNHEGATLAAVVFSHWLLDFVSHRPDLPLWLGESAKVGLGLWRSVGATLGVELALFVGGLLLYLQTARYRCRWPFWTLIGFLTLVYFANALGPQPPVDTSPALLAGPALALWLVVAWAYWADRSVMGGSREAARPLTD